jgi:hypothetical protein
VISVGETFLLTGVWSRSNRVSRPVREVLISLGNSCHTGVRLAETGDRSAKRSVC